MMTRWGGADDRLHTHAEDALNEEDLIFPRAVTRVGPKFTANVLTWEEQQAAEVKTQSELKLLGAAFQIRKLVSSCA